MAKGGIFGRGHRNSAKAPARNDNLRLLTLETMPAAVYAVGDIHGCRQLYADLQAEIVADAKAAGAIGPKLIVLLGDIVDRGPATAGLINDVLASPPEGFQRIVLRGNHEDKMSSFLRGPARHRDWLGFGGAATLRSYGLHPDPDLDFDMPVSRLVMMLDAAIPDSHRQFLDSLPLGLRVGPYFLSHAGFDPDLALEDQDPDTLMWGDPSLVDRGGDSMPISVHGHVIVDAPLITPRRIDVDTGAYSSGRLSAVRLTQGEAPYALSVFGNPG